MAREAFIERDFRPATLALIEQANVIIAEYQRAGFTLTLRQLYYQFVARDLITNTMKSYNKIGSVINDARLAGLIDWSAIEDRTRNVRRQKTWASPEVALTHLAKTYQENPWRKQRYRPEVWIEKDALVGVIEPACNRFCVPYFACRGYSSQSEQYAAGKRFARYIAAGIVPVILHLGDHDPSGIDMTRDNRDRLSMFARGQVKVKRIALTRAQVDQYNPPPNPAKQTDSRFNDYAEEYGRSSWELDALSPTVIDALLSRELDALIKDKDAWSSSINREHKRRRQIGICARNWERIAPTLEKM